MSEARHESKTWAEMLDAGVSRNEPRGGSSASMLVEINQDRPTSTTPTPAARKVVDAEAVPVDGGPGSQT